jgi:hypothetical protein
MFITGSNLLCGPAPLSMSKLKRLKDFELFTSAPSENFYIPRAFEAHAFERIYEWGPSAGLNNVHWVDEAADEAESALLLSLEVLDSVAGNGNEDGKEGEMAPEGTSEVFSPSISKWLEEKEDGPAPNFSP